MRESTNSHIIHICLTFDWVTSTIAIIFSSGIDMNAQDACGCATASREPTLPLPKVIGARTLRATGHASLGSHAFANTLRFGWATSITTNYLC